jgi:hypothetical protein
MDNVSQRSWLNNPKGGRRKHLGLLDCLQWQERQSKRQFLLVGTEYNSDTVGNAAIASPSTSAVAKKVFLCREKSDLLGKKAHK